MKMRQSILVRLILTGVLSCVLVGCSQQYATSDARMAAGKTTAEEADLDLGRSGGEKSGKSGTADPAKMEIERKIIYTADLSIVVEDFSPVEESIQRLVKQFGGYISNSNLNKANQKRRKGTWTVRIPVDSFQDFLEATGAMGVLVSSSQNAQDVSEEYWDITARIANKKKLEARILKLLERPEDEIKQVIEVERELGRVRGEIERMEGRIRYLSNRISMTTVTLEVIEEKEYQPPQAPTFSNRISKAWSGSLKNTQDAFEDGLVWLVANALPILFWIIVLPIGWFILRRFLKKSAAD